MTDKNKNKKQISQEKLLELFENQMFAFTACEMRFFTIKILLNIKEAWKQDGYKITIIYTDCNRTLDCDRDAKKEIKDIIYFANRFQSLYALGKIVDALDLIMKDKAISLVDEKSVLVIREELESLEKNQQN
jgi:hypothetical protein